MTTSTKKTALQIVHGYNEPFLSLTALYSRALREAGWRVITVYLCGNSDDRITTLSNADHVIYLEASTHQLRGLKLSLARKIRQIIREQHVSLIIGQRYKPLYLALLASLFTALPVLGVGHAFGVLNATMRQWFLRRFAQRLTLAGVSQAVTTDMQQHASMLRCVCLHNAIDTGTLEVRLLARRAARQQLGLDDNDFVFANVGRLHADKDQGTLIRAFSRIAADFPAAKLLLIGQGKCEQAYRQQIVALKLENRILLTGPVPNAATLFPAFDVYASSSAREPFGIVLAEAMLAKLPVISTDCGGAPEVLGAQAHYFHQGDDQALAAHMRSYLQTPPSERQHNGELLYQRLNEQFSFPAFSRRLLALVATIITPERTC